MKSRQCHIIHVLLPPLYMKAALIKTYWYLHQDRTLDGATSAPTRVRTTNVMENVYEGILKKAAF